VRGLGAGAGRQHARSDPGHPPHTPAIDELPEDERDVFDLVWIDGMSQEEGAHVLGVRAVTLKRRLDRGLRLITKQLADLRPREKPSDAIQLESDTE
jgi:RNA polymerase sigma-70 factor (ECF subfamily)